MQMGDMLGVTASSLVMFLVLSLLHLGDLKRAVGEELERLQQAGTTTVMYKGDEASLRGRMFSLDEVRTLTPEQQNDVLGTQAGFGGEKLPAPQASLMAVVTRGIVEAKAELILILVGVFFGLSLILMQVKSPMLGTHCRRSAARTSVRGTCICGDQRPACIRTAFVHPEPGGDRYHCAGTHPCATEAACVTTGSRRHP
jgi:hypothetical protein